MSAEKIPRNADDLPPNVEEIDYDYRRKSKEGTPEDFDEVSENDFMELDIEQDETDTELYSAEDDDFGAADTDEKIEDDEQPEQPYQSEDEEPSEQLEQSSELRPQILSAGEFSSIYSIENAEGEKHTRIESEFYDKSKDFLAQNPELKKYPRLTLAMENLAFDLSIVDALKGENLRDENDEINSRLIDDYGDLVKVLNDAETPENIRNLIEDYLDILDSEALKLISESYDDFVNSPEGEEKEVEETENRQKLEHDLEDAKEALENAEQKINEDEATLDDAINSFKRIIDDHDTDAEDLRSAFSKINDAYEELEITLSQYEEAIKDYCDVEFKTIGILSDKQGADIIAKRWDSEDRLKAIESKLFNLGEEDLPKYQIYVHKIEDIAAKIDNI